MIEHTHPVIGPGEREAVDRVLASGRLAQGTEVAALEAEFAAVVGVPHAVAVANGTVAIEIGLQAIGIGPGDEVIVPSLTFMATANAVRRVGAEPVFADIDPKTYCISPETVAPLIGPRTRAVIVVHLYGHPADMDGFASLADETGIEILEDAAQGIGSTWRGRHVGSFGRFGTFSLYATKNVTSGEGGMITTADDTVADIARSLRSHQSRMVGGRLQVATNARMTDIAAAIGRVQLSRLDEIQSARRRLAAEYDRRLDSRVTTPYVAPEAVHGWHQYTVRVPDRDTLVELAAERGVGTAVYYPVPVHLTETYQDIGPSLPETEAAAREVLSLPIRPDLTEEEQDAVIDAVNGGLA
ncbi:MAG TPA: DegT/DnrJ/EryC1/StrS family aminotransferase [Acidimicrobiia bacterium]